MKFSVSAKYVLFKFLALRLGQKALTHVVYIFSGVDSKPAVQIVKNNASPPFFQIPTRMCRHWFAPSSCVSLPCGSSSPPSTQPAAPCSTPDGSQSSPPWSSAGVCLCVFSLQRGKNSYSASAAPSVWFA